jgi:serine/threonine protein kinase
MINIIIICDLIYLFSTLFQSVKNKYIKNIYILILLDNNISYMKSVNKIDIYRISSESTTYEIFKSSVLGIGTYSVVYLGRCISSKNKEKILRIDKLVAIKKINIRKLTQNSSKMLTTEIEITKEMILNKHQNIVECYDVINDLDVTYIIMEFCDGGDLSSLLVGKPFKNLYLKYYFGQIVNAIKFLRENTIIHRDMKPKNILLSNDKKILKLCDFGFAKHNNSLKRVTTVCGSPLYMAPEIYKNESYTESVDVWSLGIILFEMVFGVHPFAKYNDVESLSASIVKNDIHIGKSNEVSDECLDLLQRMLQKYEYNRINIDDLFVHPWIINECIISENELVTMFSNTNIHSYLYCLDITSYGTISEKKLDNSKSTDENIENSDYDLIFELDS